MGFEPGPLGQELDAIPTELSGLDETKDMQIWDKQILFTLGTEMFYPGSLFME